MKLTVGLLRSILSRLPDDTLVVVGEFRRPLTLRPEDPAEPVYVALRDSAIEPTRASLDPKGVLRPLESADNAPPGAQPVTVLRLHV